MVEIEIRALHAIMPHIFIFLLYFCNIAPSVKHIFRKNIFSVLNLNYESFQLFSKNSVLNWAKWGISELFVSARYPPFRSNEILSSSSPIHSLQKLLSKNLKWGSSKLNDYLHFSEFLEAEILPLICICYYFRCWIARSIIINLENV